MKDLKIQSKQANRHFFPEIHCAVVVKRAWVICSALELQVSWDR